MSAYTESNLTFRKSPELEPLAKGDVPYSERNLPLTFLGVKHSRWTKKQLVEILETLGSTHSTQVPKIDLYETVHLRYNPNKNLQRTIDALGTLAQTAAGPTVKAKTQVYEAVLQAGLRRADLAKQKRIDAKQRLKVGTDHEPAPQIQTESSHLERVPKSERNVDLDLDLDNDRPRRRIQSRAQLKQHPPLNRLFDSSDVEDEQDDKNNRYRKPPTPPKSKGHRQRKADSDLEELSDGKAFWHARRLNPRVTLADRGEDTRPLRKRPASQPPERDNPKRSKINLDADVEVDRARPPAVAFGTSTAIRDSAAFRVGLEPIDYKALSESQSCQVCSDDLDPFLNFQISVAAQCHHAPEICLSCWEQHISAQADSKTWDSIKCPHADCSAILNHDDMYRFAPTEIFRRFDSYSTNQALHRTPGYRLCAHEGCGSGGFIEHEHSPYMDCADCHKRTCLRCKLIYHPNQTCDAYRAWLADATKGDEADRVRVKRLKLAEDKSAKYLSKKAKTCPNDTCGANIQKTSGCDHMICRICRFQFCWVCLAAYMPILREGNHMHDKSCKYHFGSIPGHT